MLRSAGNRYKNALSAIKLYLAEAVPLCVFICCNLAHAGFILAKMEIMFKLQRQLNQSAGNEGSLSSIFSGGTLSQKDAAGAFWPVRTLNL